MKHKVVLGILAIIIILMLIISHSNAKGLDAGTNFKKIANYAKEPVVKKLVEIISATATTHHWSTSITTVKKRSDFIRPRAL